MLVQVVVVAADEEAVDQVGMFVMSVTRLATLPASAPTGLVVVVEVVAAVVVAAAVASATTVGKPAILHVTAHNQTGGNDVGVVAVAAEKSSATTVETLVTWLVSAHPRVPEVVELGVVVVAAAAVVVATRSATSATRKVTLPVTAPIGSRLLLLAG